jgi:hypothetical protein
MHGQMQIQNIGLQALARKVKTIVGIFQDISFAHFYRELNQAT